MNVLDRKKSMWLLFAMIISLFAVSIVGAQEVDDGGGRIVGGEEATPGEFPWMASMQYGNSHFCGGSLISPDWVLTAAHCADAVNGSTNNLTVVIGRHALSSSDGQTRTVEQIIMHPNYSDSTLDYDVALLKLSSPVNGVEMIGLVSAESTIDDPGLDSIVIGWGHTTVGGNLSDALLKVTVPVVSNTVCSQPYNGITARMICAGLQEGGKDSCQGDSGGPMIVADGDSFKHAGIVSWGAGCAYAGYYGVYARVSELKGWIESEMEEEVPEPTPTMEPTVDPTPSPTTEPTPSPEPTIIPTDEPTPSPEPTTVPTIEPTPSPEPTIIPTDEPTPSPEPTTVPTIEPTPSPEPTIIPTDEPTPSPEPTTVPTAEPTSSPEPTVEPTPLPAETIEITGTVDAIDDETITVDGLLFFFDEFTQIDGDLEVGATVEIEGRLKEGVYYAVSIEVEDTNGGGNEFEFEWMGIVTEVSDTSITIKSRWRDKYQLDTFIINDETSFDGEPQQGDFVYVYATYHSDETMTALYIEVLDDDGGESPDVVKHEGVVVAVSAESLTILSDIDDAELTFVLKDDTELSSLPVVGDLVYVEATESLDALFVLVLEDEEIEPEIVNVRGIVTTIDETTISVADQDDDDRAITTFLIDENTKMWQTPEVGDRVRVKGGDVDGVLTAYAVRIRDSHPQPIKYVELIGVVEAISAESYTIDGQAFALINDTQIEGNPEVGDSVYVFAEISTAGNTAIYIAAWEMAQRFELDGEIEAFDVNSVTIDGYQIAISEETIVKGTLAIGAEAFVKGSNLNGQMTADKVRVRKQEAGEIAFVDEVGVISAISDAEIVVGQVAYVIDENTEMVGTALVGNTVWILGLNKGDEMTALYVVILDAVRTEGTVDEMSADSITVDGVRYLINSNTRILDSIKSGDSVYVGSNVSRAGQEALLIRAQSAPTAVGYDSANAPSVQMGVWIIVGVAAVMILMTRREFMKR